MSLNDTLLRQSLATLSSSNADKRSSLIVLRNMFLINAILLNERLPEQFEIIKHKNMRNTMEIFGNVLLRSSLWIKLARSDGDEQPLALAKWITCQEESCSVEDLYGMFPPCIVPVLESVHYPTCSTRLSLGTLHGNWYKHQFCCAVLSVTG